VEGSGLEIVLEVFRRLLGEIQEKGGELQSGYVVT
jgi:hypothetical protein